MKDARRVRRLQVVVALIPATGILSAPFVANRVEPRVLGLPFLLAWIVFWVIGAAAAMAFVGRLEPDCDAG